MALYIVPVVAMWLVLEVELSDSNAVAMISC